VNGANVVYVGPGDFHDNSFDGMVDTIDLSSIQVPGLLPVDNLGCPQSLQLYPTASFRNSFFTNAPRVYTAVVASTCFLLLLLFLTFDWLLKRRHQVLQREAVRSNAIVTSLFPSQVRDRLGRRFSSRLSQETQPKSSRRGRKVRLLSVNFQTPKSKLKTYLKSAESTNDPEVFGTAPIADLFPNATVFFADIAGFTAWSSEREPTQVFILLETIYCAFDALAKRCGVFKVETIGDCYMAVTGVPDPQENHAIVMTIFAKACLKRMQKLVKQLEATLGPGTADLAIRVGLHSGPITAGVLRGEKSRFQLFGDTVNTASRMESNGQRDRIHMSEETAQLLSAAGKGHWIVPREDRIVAKGKGELKTFWFVDRETKLQNDEIVDVVSDDCVNELDVNEQSDEDDQALVFEKLSYRSSGVWAEARWEENQEALLMMDRNKLSRLVNWNVDVLLGCLKAIVASRQEFSLRVIKPLVHRDSGLDLNHLNPRDEVTESIISPNFDPNAAMRRKDPASVEISPHIVSQLRKYVSCIASLYRNNPFHNFEHASHVTMSSNKLLQRIITPENLDYQREDVTEGQRRVAVASDLHDRTYGITSDPVTQFTVVFSALIHDVDHAGVPNSQLVQQKDPLAVKFRNQSVAEQNSIVLAWDLLMTDDFADLRRCIYATEAEAKRFRQLLVNSVIATDLFDSDLREFRENRWQKAFSNDGESPCDGPTQQCAKTESVYRKATAVIEHIIQASDVAHTMQHWHIYQKWNEKLFEELTVAFRKGTTSIDPALTWYQNELEFFDNYVVPLAKKLKECGVFGVSGDEYLNYAEQNRKEWELTGEQVVAQMVSRYTRGDDNNSGHSREL
jgi:class 3 adenylate cyclase